MEKKMIKEIFIKKYKKFEDFKIEGFKRINLLTGFNNVGKTSLLEALFLGSDRVNLIKHYIVLLYIIFKSRYSCNHINNRNYFIKMMESLKSISVKTNVVELEIEIENTLIGTIAQMKKPSSDVNVADTLKKLFKNSEVKNLNVELFSELLKNNITSLNLNKLNLGVFQNIDIVNFIHNLNTRDTIKSLIEKIKKDLEAYDILEKELQNFDNDILKIDIFDNEVYLYLNSIDDWIHIKELGEGTQNYILILSALFVNKDRILYIDEIENGIHYTNFQKMWKIIYDFSKKLNVQVFVTTHSYDVIEAFSTLNEECVLIELGEKNKKLDYIIYKAPEVKKELLSHREVRGWK
ncbi:AAA family ATPase [Caminibacter sp.]